MPRRNINARERKTAFHGATKFSNSYRPKCAGCLFVGHDFTCTTSDGQCLVTQNNGETKTMPEGRRNGKRFRNT